ncbi:hypothetical protein [Haloarchaeobius sp. DT45]|uniref:hypothetical protein n=1 Tax=Haloarchaeobius sp. DT45 TaxID=3446116 RepID=UPI003F6AB2BC
MPRVPDDFEKEFDAKGVTFFEIAELLYSNPDRQYTQGEIAEIMDRSNTTISKHTREMVNEDWLTRYEDQTTFAWNSNAHNPASTEGITAVRRFYADLFDLYRKHSNTGPGVLAIIGFAMILAAIVVFTFYLGFSTGLTQESAIPPVIYLIIAIGSLITGTLVTAFSWVQANANRIFRRHAPSDLFRDEK